jgi:hypothetical protein
LAILVYGDRRVGAGRFVTATGGRLAFAGSGELGNGRVSWLIGPVCENAPRSGRHRCERLKPLSSIAHPKSARKTIPDGLWTARFASESGPVQQWTTAFYVVN